MLPTRLRSRLEHAPRLVVAPVGLGFGQAELAEWAKASGRRAETDLEALRGSAALWLPRSRREAQHVGGWALEDTLFLSEAELTWSFEEWEQQLPEASAEFRRSSFEATGGWPEGLRLCRQLQEAAPRDLAGHPLVQAHLRRLVPASDLPALERLARFPLIVPELGEAPQSELADLYDRGYLYQQGGALALPRLLQQALVPHPDPGLSRELARRLWERGEQDLALEALRRARLWPEYLESLAHTLQAQTPEGELRRLLAPVPEALHGHPAFLYLVGLLERIRGELGGANRCYQLAFARAEGELRGRIGNARAVVLAMLGRPEEALQTLESVAPDTLSARLQGEIQHNRAGLLLEARRYAEAEASLKQAIAAFREAGEYRLEARSAHLLALFYHERGLLTEARRRYQEALDLLAHLGQPTGLVRANLAETLLLQGEAPAAEAQLDSAQAEAAAAGQQRVLGYVRVNRALAALLRGQREQARALLEDVLRQPDLEVRLRAEAELLLARLLRLEGQPGAAVGHAEAALPVGLRAELELALLGERSLDSLVERARSEEARLELALALLHRGQPEDLHEALDLILTQQYRALLDDPDLTARLAPLAAKDPALRALFPLELSTFGPCTLRFLGRTYTEAAFPTRKSLALLIRLALSDSPQRREALAEQFWADAGNPMGSLQTAIYHLNRTLGQKVVEGGRGSLELAFPVRLDLTAFERAAQEALHLPSSLQPPALRKALKLAQGEPLASFPEWFAEERAAAEALRTRLLRRLVELTAPKNPQAAIEHLQALVRLEPYDLEARRQLIHLYRSAGEGELARREEERLQQLERELG